jgi:hypothetical protein
MFIWKVPPRVSLILIWKVILAPRSPLAHRMGVSN